MTQHARDPARASVAVGRDQKKRGWMPWLLLLLLALLVVAAIVLATSGGDDESTSGAGATTPTAATPTSAGPAAASTPAEAQAAPAAAGEATLTAGDASIFGADAAAIEEHVSETATGSGLTVLSVGGSGFFVGTGAADQQFVEFGSEVGEGEAEPYAPKAGDVVSLTGPVRPAPKDPAATLRLTPEAAQAVTERGAYVNAETVTQAG